jgi:divalent metal cation (Fe/Co/Zn/Cd) transporter
MQYEILGVIAENHDRMCEFKSVHTRQSGKDIFIEIDLVMPYDYRLEELYTLESTILGKLHGSFPTAIPRVYVTPCDRSCDHPTGTTCPVKRAALQS